ncbi:uncharacterized protein LOC142349392 isoform X2 [Convolutriloba macropyga]|uniref:uncharacterized protein LOC142349392 isoform X2 n=1 Tax=Convolutriloba macropyga TaxID=536237 RepID=UPI003F528E9C
MEDKFNKYDRHCKEHKSSNQNASTTISASLSHTSHRSKHSRTASITQKGPLLHFLPMIISFICLTIAFADGAPADLDPLDFKRDLEPGVDSPTMEMAKRLESYQDQMTVYKRAVVDTSVNRYVQNPKIPCRFGAPCKRPNSNSFACKCSSVSSVCWAANQFSEAKCHFTNPSFGVFFVQP